jgi:hypothetical protein
MTDIPPHKHVRAGAPHPQPLLMLPLQWEHECMVCYTPLENHHRVLFPLCYCACRLPGTQCRPQPHTGKRHCCLPQIVNSRCSTAGAEARSTGTASRASCEGLSGCSEGDSRDDGRGGHRCCDWHGQLLHNALMLGLWSSTAADQRRQATNRASWHSSRSVLESGSALHAEGHGA